MNIDAADVRKKTNRACEEGERTLFANQFEPDVEMEERRPRQHGA